MKLDLGVSLILLAFFAATIVISSSSRTADVSSH